MTLLIAGLCLWIGTHLIPSAAPGLRQGCIDKLGFNAYRGIFSLLVLSSLGLIIMGWRSSQPVSVYLPAQDLRVPALLLMVLSFLCFGASQRATRIGRLVRHPQLTGLLLWSISHLLTNGDSRSLWLFGALGSWAVLEMILISRREGAWEKPQAPAWGVEIGGVAITLVVMAIVLWAHPWIAGIPVL
ncbi:MAG: NnrU family protein [Halieaceae bacterium]